jgi:thiol peroxidase
LSEGTDPTDDVARAPLGFGRLGHPRLLRPGGRCDRLEVERARDRHDTDCVSSVIKRDHQCLKGPVGIGTEGLDRLEAERAVIGIVVVVDDAVLDTESPEHVDRGSHTAMVPHMAQITLGGNPINTNGDLPAAGAAAPDFTLTKADWTPVSAADLAGQRVVMNIFPSLDTGLCQTTVRTFNERAADLENTAVLCVSADLPPAAARFCGAEGIENVITGSTFKNPEVLEALGVKMLDGKLQGLAARSVVVLDTDGTVLHSELVPEIASEPDYDAAIAALG